MGTAGRAEQEQARTHDHAAAGGAGYPPVCAAKHAGHLFGDRAKDGFTNWGSGKVELDRRLAGA